MKTKFKIILLIIVHLIILNGFFTYRYHPLEGRKFRAQFKIGNFQGDFLDYIKLFHSTYIDEAFYFEWSTVVLGKSFKPDHPFVKRSEKEFTERLSKNPKFRMPYSDAPFEYPPLLAIPILSARLISHDFLSYTRAFAFIVSLAYLGCLALAFLIWKRIPPDDRISWPSVLTLSALSLIALGQIYVTRLDVFPALVFLLALYFFLKRKYYISSLWVALGGLVKVYPLLLAPLFAIALLYQKKYRELFFSCVIFVLVFLGINFGLYFLTEGHYLDSFQYHSSRGIEIESLYALVAFFTKIFMGWSVFSYKSHYAVNIWMPHVDFLIKISYFIPFIFFAAIYIVFGRSQRKLIYQEENPSLILFPSVLLVLSFILTFKILSPQFLIWLTPLIFLTLPKNKTLFSVTFIILLFLTQLIFPALFHLLVTAHPIGITLLAVRNFGLLFIFFWLFRNWWVKIYTTQPVVK